MAVPNFVGSKVDVARTVIAEENSPSAMVNTPSDEMVVPSTQALDMLHVTV